MATSTKKTTSTKATTKKTVEAVETPVVEATVETTVAAPAPVMDALDAKIKAFGGNDETLTALKNMGVETVDDLAVLTEADLVAAGLKLVKARKLIDDIKTAKAAEAPASAATPAPTVAPMAFPSDFGAILPTVPSDESLLRSLKVGGMLKVDDSTYNSALRVFLADRAGLFTVPEKLSVAMEQFADDSDEPVDPSFFKLKNQITRRNYGELFAAIEGLDGTFVSKKRREEFLRRMRSELCPAIRSAWLALNGWYDSMVTTAGNPAMLVSSLAGALSGAGPAFSAANMPPTDVMCDASDTLKDAINHTFRGTSGPVAAAMAYDAMEIVKTLEDRSMPAMIGMANRDQMLKKLGVSITANYARLEQNLVRFVLAFIKFTDEGAGNEIAYLTALWQLGRQIPWEELVGGVDGVKTIGGKNPLL